MIFTLIGFPPEDTELLKSYCGNRMAFSWGRPTVAEQTAIAADMARYWRYCERFVADRIADPRDDFTSDHVRVHLDDPEALTVDEIVGVIYGLSFAGHETTTNLTTNAVRRLLEHPDQWQEICADPTLIPGAVEEVLRFDTERRRVAAHHDARAVDRRGRGACSGQADADARRRRPRPGAVPRSGRLRHPPRRRRPAPGVRQGASTSASERRSPGWSSASCWSCSPSTHRTSRWSPTRT
jgi:hypothetical protein